MLFYISSTDPSDYSTVKFSTNALAGTGNIEFRINQLATTATFLITTEQDYITFEFYDNNESREVTFNFIDKSYYDKDTLHTYLDNMFYNSNTLLHVTYNDIDTLTFKRDEGLFRIKEASHRVKLLLGLYCSALPTKLSNEYTAESVPYNCYGNSLYLRSKISNIVGFNNSVNQDVYISICYHIFEVLYPNAPIICRTPGNYIKIKPTDLTALQFTLVDFQNEPVILKAPLNLILECKVT